MRKSSPSTHAHFFTSLKHLEKRLKLETPEPPPPPPPPPIEHHDTNTNTTQQSDSLGTPMYLNYNNSTINTNSESEIPLQFLSNSPHFPPTHDHTSPVEHSDSNDDDIEVLMQLLRLSEEEVVNDGGVGQCGDDDGFYGKIVGVKGPKSGKEVERLEGWIKYFSKGEKIEEPLRLAHLLMAKAAFVHSGDDDDGDGFGGFVFPSTIDEFLQNDPPVD